MTTSKILLIACTCVLLAGCTTTRSISDSGVHGRYQETSELSEFDVLGINSAHTASDQEIASALNQSRQTRLKQNSTILLVQSGTAFPDQEMVSQLSQHFRVVPFSGAVPQRNQQQTNAPQAKSLSRSLRLAAAQAGAEAIVCYWGILESGSEGLATKTVSWVPVVNWIVPDEKQHMRIRVKLAVVDVRSGTWTMLTPPATIESKSFTTNPRRDVVDQKQVLKLKGEAYTASVNELVRLSIF